MASDYYTRGGALDRQRYIRLGMYEWWLGKGLPLSPETRGFIWNKFLAAFKPKHLRPIDPSFLSDDAQEWLERTVIYNWMSQWLKYVLWYASMLSGLGKIDDFLRAPMCARVSSLIFLISNS